MFKPSQIHHSHCHDDCLSALPATFGVLCWNVYKKNRSDETFASYLQKEFGDGLDLLLFQEAAFGTGSECRLEGYTFHAAANLAYHEGYYGVLTASRAEALEAKAFLSQEKEAFFGTHKSMLLTRYRLENGNELLVLNIHAINFRESRAYAKEKERILRFLSDYTGALILAGDLNSWNSSRSEKIEQIRQRLGLKRVPFAKSKAVFGHPIDFIFYRGLELLEHRVDTAHGISDHHPLFARFGTY